MATLDAIQLRAAIEGRLGRLTQLTACAICYQQLLQVRFVTLALVNAVVAVAIRLGIERAVELAAAQWEGQDRNEFAILLAGSVRHIIDRDSTRLN